MESESMNANDLNTKEQGPIAPDGLDLDAQDTAGASVQEDITPPILKTGDEALFCRVECLLFVAGDPTPIAELARVLERSTPETQALLQRMEAHYRCGGRGVMPLVTGETVQLISNRAYVADVQALLQPDETKNVSQSLLETLAVVAYRQPVTRGDVERIRGVRCDYAVTQLAKLGLIHEVGRKDVVGRPVLFGTTDRFLRHFGIHSIEEMPDFFHYSQEIPQEDTQEITV